MSDKTEKEKEFNAGFESGYKSGVEEGQKAGHGMKRLYRKLSLFLGIVWRYPDEALPRLSIRHAWEIASK